MPAAADRGETIAADTVQRLAALAESEHTTLSVALLTVAGALVHRYVGWDAVIIGISTRPSPDGASAEGHEGEPVSFVSLDLAGDPTFACALGRAASPTPAVEAPAMAADHPAELIDPGERRWRIWIQSERQRHALVSRAPGGDRGVATLCLSLAAHGGGLQVTSESIDIEEDEGPARIARHFSRLAASAASAPGTPLSRLPLLDEDEYTRIVAEWNATDYDAPDGAVHDLVAAQAAAQPEACALRFGTEAVSYGELEARTNQLAHYLRERQVRLDVPVAICLERSIEAIIANLAVLKAGGVYVPLDPAYPPARLAEMLADCAPAVIITRGDQRAALGECAAVVVDLDAEATAIGARPASRPVVDVSPDHAAYILYTSGSEGKPKPLVGTHRSITNSLCDPPFRRDADDEICCLDSSLSFAFSIARTYLPLCCGRTLVVLPHGQERDLVALVHFWAAEGIGNVAMVTPVCRRLLGFGPRLTSTLQQVRTVVVGGALITPDLMASFFEALPQATLCAGYAASEIGGPIVRKYLSTDSHSISPGMGQAFPNTRVYVLDSALAPVPVGVTGEIYVAAAHLSWGYLRQPSMTAVRFVANPFARLPGERLYRTGDLGRYLANGELEVLGRVDDMIKIRGFRVELHEIEAVLSTHPDVQATAVAVRELSGESQIVAYVVARAGADPSAADLRAFLGARLPEYMLPSRCVRVDELPVTQLGKVDRARLPDVGTERPPLDVPYHAATDALEAEIAQLWESLLQIEGIGMDDNFLEIGGDSVFATMVTARLCDRFDIDLSVAVFFECPTVRTLAAHVRATASIGPAAAAGGTGRPELAGG